MRALRTVLAALVVGVVVLRSNVAVAQSPADLAAGRQLFADALSDEEHGRFAEALGKYRRVLLIRDTPSVRYRMGSSLEHLGKIAQAVEEYSAAIRISGDGKVSPADAEVVRSAQARLDALAPKVAHLSVRFSPAQPEPVDAEVTIDGEPVLARALADVRLDPGSHVVAATAKGTRPFRTQIDVSEGARVEVPIQFEPLAASPPPPPPPPPPAGRSYRTIGIVTGAAGVVLLTGGVVVALLRSSEIGKLNDACPNGNCPASREQELSSAHDRAKLEGPLSIALVATGAAALGTGIALFALSDGKPKNAAALVPTPGGGAMFSFARGF